MTSQFITLCVFQKFNYDDPPVGWGSTYCFTDVGVCVSVTLITKGTLAQICFRRYIFCSLGHYLLIFAMNLTVIAFFIGTGSPNFVKSTRGILIKRVRKLHRQMACEMIIVDLQLTCFCLYCVVLKLPILWPRSLSSRIVS